MKKAKVIYSILFFVSLMWCTLTLTLDNVNIGVIDNIPIFSEFDDTINTEIDIATLDKCIDGDTAWFNVNGKRTKVRFLFIDTPESTNTIEPQGKEASNFTCNMLSNAESISLEYDGAKTDKYGRVLAWVWADGVLVQEELAKNGYIEKFYDYGDYKNEKLIRDSINDIYNIFEE